jgi:hypothetical protein
MMAENGDKILEVVRLFIDNINETTKGVDRVEIGLRDMASDLGKVRHTFKVVGAMFSIAIFIAAFVVFIGNKGWLTPEQEKPAIVQTALDKELKELKKELRDLLEEVEKAKERENEDSKRTNGGN